MKSSRTTPYKLELIEEHSEDEGGLIITARANTVDPCRGPHPSTGRIQIFHLLNVLESLLAWNSDNAMMQRIYGTAWFDKKDWRTTFKCEVSQGTWPLVNWERAWSLHDFTRSRQGFLPFWLPNGATIHCELNATLLTRKCCRLPTRLHSTTSGTYKTSGHWDHYRKEDMSLTMDMGDGEEFGPPSRTVLTSYRSL